MVRGSSCATAWPSRSRLGPPLPTGLASFSSGGPRNGDSALKPDISAPGSPIVSTLIGSGTRGSTFSGTSMATPHVAGIAALVQQAHPKWKPASVKAAIVNSGDPGDIGGYADPLCRLGLRQRGVGGAHAGDRVRRRQADELSFGLVEFTKDFSKDQNITLHNDGDADATFNVAAVLPQGSPHAVALDRTQVTVRRTVMRTCA